MSGLLKKKKKGSQKLLGGYLRTKISGRFEIQNKFNSITRVTMTLISPKVVQKVGFNT